MMFFADISRRRLLGAITAVAAAVGMAAPAAAVDFAGKRVELLVPFGEGGGADVWGRFMAPHLQRHLPGEPTVIVRNVPGAGGIAGANEFQDRARTDGTSVFVLSASIMLNSLLGDPRVRYNLDEWHTFYVGPLGLVAYGSPSLGIEGPEDIAKLQGQSLVFGGNTPTSLDMTVLLALDQLGLDVHAVFGISRGPARLAFERGEFNVDFQTAAAYQRNVTPMVEDGTAVPLFSFGVLGPDGEFVRDPTFPDIPHFVEAYETMHGEKPSGLWFDAWQTFFHAAVTVNKGLSLPAGTPPEIVEAYSQALEAMLQDPTFIAEAEEHVGRYEQATGERAKEWFALATTASPEVREFVLNWLEEKHDFTF
jgi:tripartite-type tricarboxylate transporter receptor subunit TctC